VPALGADGREYPMRLSIARIGDTFVGTLTPTLEPLIEAGDMIRQRPAGA
jgi:hypothetical protein